MQAIDIESQVSEILAAAGVTMSAHYMGQRTRDKWECDEWAITFTSVSRPNDPQEFEYFTGFGHRAPATKESRVKAAWGFNGLTENDRKGLTSYGRRYLAEVEKLRKPVAPGPAGVLHSLLLDSDAVWQSFESWCSEYGFNSDSIKDEQTYRECQRNSDKLNRIFNHATREALREALEEY